MGHRGPTAEPASPLRLPGCGAFLATAATQPWGCHLAGDVIKLQASMTYHRGHPGLRDVEGPCSDSGVRPTPERKRLPQRQEGEQVSGGRTGGAGRAKARRQRSLGRLRN